MKLCTCRFLLKIKNYQKKNEIQDKVTKDGNEFVCLRTVLIHCVVKIIIHKHFQKNVSRL